MAYKVLYRKYRPDSFENLYGQEAIKKLLSESIFLNKVSHAYLFHGPRGTGKTSTAKIFAKAINCENNIYGNPCNKCNSCINFSESPDIIEIDAASNNGVDEIRNLRDSAKILPTFSKYKIYIIDEVHMLSGSAWNAFLKTLEEPPSHVIFILATTELQKIPLTILSRCQRFSFKKLTPDIIVSNILRISKLENIEITDSAANLIAELADGAMRDALSMLDQLSKENVLIDDKLIGDTFGFVGSKDVEKIFELLNDACYDDVNAIFNEYGDKGLNINLFVNKIIAYIFDLEMKIVNGMNYPIAVCDLKNMAFDLSNVFGKKNSLDLIKIILFSYYQKCKVDNCDKIKITNKSSDNEIFDKNINKVDNLSIDKLVNNLEQKSNVKEETKVEVSNSLDNKEDTSNVVINASSSKKKINDEFIKIRINNSYVNASRDCKKEFTELWNKFLNDIEFENNHDLLNLIENVSIEVVSPTNVIFANKSQSTVLLFNESLDLIENAFNKACKNKKSFICLTLNDWNIEKNRYMELLKNKQNNFVYIEEKDDIINEDDVNLSVSIANDLFGDSLLEVK